ncbi:uncharacterized protein LOC115744782 isoform X2 [Rhodamnia argentea]|uniref:Uncharacterized protein LOC115744782 isoform X2 n=1 Tax=Rhodamnia argentea TaxID=178133 RepID=A0A8B8PP40_9MYRT|nr:uncharacterized protein LOC115744782 isoform X2 [Rhodamnia argentea]
MPIKVALKGFCVVGIFPIFISPLLCRFFFLVNFPLSTQPTRLQPVKMRKSPVYPKSDASDYDAMEFDPQMDFLRFLDEARQHKCEPNVRASSPYSAEVAGKRNLGEDKRSKKSWKSSLLSWLRTEKKSKYPAEPASHPHNHKPRKIVSGPIIGASKESDAWLRRLNSGSFPGLFNSTKRTENEMRYISLEQLDKPHGVKNYGPVYLVT